MKYLITKTPIFLTLNGTIVLLLHVSIHQISILACITLGTIWTSFLIGIFIFLKIIF